MATPSKKQYMLGSHRSPFESILSAFGELELRGLGATGTFCEGLGDSESEAI